MTLKAFKAAIQVGTRITVTEHWQAVNVGQVRVVTKTQGNGYWFNQPGANKPDGTPIRYWGDYPPKASMLQFDGRIARVDIGDNRTWTLDIGSAS